MNLSERLLHLMLCCVSIAQLLGTMFTVESGIYMVAMNKSIQKFWSHIKACAASILSGKIFSWHRYTYMTPWNFFCSEMAATASLAKKQSFIYLINERKQPRDKLLFCESVN